MAVLTFPAAIAETVAAGLKRHVLLGNGFSIACRPDAFAYGRLFDEADFSGLSVSADSVFGLSGTTDFEKVIEVLRSACDVLDLYPNDASDLRQTLEADADLIRDALADVLARRHPDNVGSISDDEYSYARRFLANFDRIFTVNYDLLLYWTLLHEELPPEVSNKDGFRSDPDDPDAPYVVWDAYSAPSQEVSYLHGGLHLYDAGSRLKKITWARTGVPLIDQVRDALADGLYPRVVTEGTSDEKLEGILHSAYLHKALRSLSTCTGALFVHGHSLAANDEHILKAVVEGKYRRLYVGLHGDPDSLDNQKIRDRADALALRRPEKKPLPVRFYDSNTAQVWRASSA